MEYIGKLYGKIGNKYFDTGKTSEDFDLLENDKSTYFAKELDAMLAEKNILLAEIKKLEQEIMQQDNFRQIAFKLEGDIETLKEQQAEIDDSKMENDISFLYEMKQRAINAFDKRDVSDKEMLYTMIDDWIDDLRSKRASAKTEC